MIRINSIEELKTYVSYIESKYIDGLHSYIVISFEKEGKLNRKKSSIISRLFLL